MQNNNPLILVFYLDNELMKNNDIIQPFANSVNDILSKKNANTIAFFLPTLGEERVECINPVMVKEADMDKINKLIEDIKTNFSIGVDMNIPDEEIILNEKECVCGKNPDGKCEC